MYFKPFLPIMLLFSKTLAFQSMNLKKLGPRPNHLIMRLKKTMSNNHDPDMSDGSKGSRKTKSLAPLYKPRSENQRQYVSHLFNSDVPIVLGIGPAGCGKTLFACVSAIEGLKKGVFQKIVLTRPIVPVEEEELGFLPGSLVKKMDPWTRPLMDIFLEYYPQHELEFMIGSGVIEISPLAYMRGRTFKRCFIIADEMQNSTPNQMLMLTTRIGEGSKMAITGDLKQSDRCAANGLLDIMNKITDFREHSNLNSLSTNSSILCGIAMVKMNKGDIERSPIVSKILEIYSFDKIKSLTASTGTGTGTGTVVSEKIINENTDLGEPVDDAALIPKHHISPYFP